MENGKCKIILLKNKTAIKLKRLIADKKLKSENPKWKWRRRQDSNLW